jgi:hypothetical protein
MSLRLTFSSFYGHYHKQANVGHTSLFLRLLSGKGLQYRADLDDFLVAFGFRKLSNMVFLAYFDLILAFIPRSLSKCKYTASHPTYIFPRRLPTVFPFLISHCSFPYPCSLWVAGVLAFSAKKLEEFSWVVIYRNGLDVPAMYFLWKLQ